MSFRRAVAAIGLIAMPILQACGAGEDRASGLELQQSAAAIYGTGVIDTHASRAQDVTSINGIAGSTGVVFRYLASVGDWFPSCAGVLVAPDRFVSSAGCLSDSTRPDGKVAVDQVLVAFTQHGDTSGLVPFAVSRIDMPVSSPGVGLSVATLTAPVPANVVGKVAPIFVGDLQAAVDSGRFSLDSGVVSGLGTSCPGCSDSRRRAGALNVPVRLGTFPSGHAALLAEPDAAVGAMLTSTGGYDNGGGLFLWDNFAQRYALVGVYSFGSQLDGIYQWVPTANLPAGILANGTLLAPLLGPDADRDGQLDASDNCAPAFCEAQGWDPAVCVNADQRDEEGDGVGDACGRCNGGWDLGTRNSNREAEDQLQAEGVASADHRSDLCDPVPLMRFEPKTQPVLRSLPSQEPSGEGDEEVLRFRVASVMGIGGPDESFTEDIAFRYCSCFHPMSGAPMPADQCGAPAYCGAADVHPAAGRWQETMARLHDPSQPYPVTVPATGGAPQLFRRAEAGPTLEMSWPWYNLSYYGHVETKGHPDDRDFQVARGFLGTTVLARGGTRSGRDADTEFRLRSSVNFYELPKLGVVLPDLHVPDLRACSFPHCRPWVHPLDRLLWRILDWDDYLVHPAQLVYADGRSILARGDDAIDVSEILDPTMREMLERESGTVAWLSPSEPVGFLQEIGNRSRGVFVSRDERKAMRVEVIERSLTSYEAPVQVELDTEQHAAYSAVEDALYVAGRGEILRYDLRSGEIQPIEPNGVERGEVVLSVAYDSFRRVLYVLDVGAGAEGGARVVAHHVGDRDRRADVLLDVPFDGWSTLPSLSLDERRNVVLVAGRERGFTAWTLRASDGTSLGRYDSDLSLLDAPGTGFWSPVVPVYAETGLAYDVLDAGDFVAGEPCQSL